MRIAVLGTGFVGATLGRRWVEKGHEVTFGSRDPSSEKAQELAKSIAEQAQVKDNASAAEAGDVVVASIPWTAAEETIKSLGNLDGKVIVDCINPINASFDGLDLGFATSASEKVSEWAPGAHVVKAFNTVSVATMQDPSYDGLAATMFYCGDDAEAKSVVHQLAADLGLDPVDAGPLVNARQLEPFAMLYIHLACKEGWGSNCAFKIMKRPAPV